MRETAAQAIRRRARVIRQNLWMILGVGLLFAMIGNVTEPAPEDRYLAGAQVDTGGVQEQVLLVYQFAAKPDPLKVRVQQAVETALSPEVIANASRRLQGRITARDLELTAGAAGLTGRVGIAVESEDPRAAARVANVVAEEFVKVRNREYRNRIADISRELRAARSEAGIPPKNVDVLANLVRYSTEQYQTRLDMLEEFAQPAIVAKRASVPTQPLVVLPWAGMIFLLGVGLAVTAAFLRESMRARREDPVLAATFARAEPLGVLEDDRPGQLAGFVAAQGQGLLRVAVCGLRPGDRALATATALAGTLAAQGRATLLVEGELARPRLASRLGLEPSPGLAELLRGDAAPDQVVRHTVASDDLDGPDVVVAGEDGHLPPEGLGPVLEALGRGVEVQVVVLPSPLEAAELALVAPLLDRVVVVAERELRGEDELRAIGRALAPLGVRHGLVLCDRDVEAALERGRLRARVSSPPRADAEPLAGVPA